VNMTTSTLSDWSVWLHGLQEGRQPSFDGVLSIEVCPAEYID